MLRYLNYLHNRFSRALIEYNVRRGATILGRMTCGLNAVVHNHGPRENIRIGTGVILDGVLECYARGCLEIGEHSYIGRSRVFASKRVQIGKGVFISDFVVIFDSNLHPLNGKKRFRDMVEWHSGEFPDVYTNIPAKRVTLGDYSWIGALSVIGKGVVIGEGAVVGAGSVVTKDVQPYTIAAGNPAKFIRELGPDER